MCSALAALVLRHAQAARAQSLDQLPHRDRLGPAGDELGVEPLWNVIVVEIECAAADPVELRKGVQLVEGGVAHQMRPEHFVCWPPRLVD